MKRYAKRSQISPLETSTVTPPSDPSLNSGISAQSMKCNGSAEITGSSGNSIVYESFSSRIVRHRICSQDEQNVDFIDYSQCAGTEVAIKSLSEPRSSLDELSYLNNEYHILSRHLINCSSSVRKAVGRSKAKRPACEKTSRENAAKTQHGTPAIYLEWVDGVTIQDLIEEWRQSREETSGGFTSDSNKTPSPKDDLLVVLLMYRIALAIADIHEAGVIHNNISSDNIIVSFGNESDENKSRDTTSTQLSTKIIDFGYATTLAMAEADDLGEPVNDDLYSLGVVYREILLATRPSNTTRCSLTRGSISQIGDDILPDSVPESLRSIIACLTHSQSSSSYLPPYRSAKEVVEDLEQMLNDSDVFLYERHKEKSEIPCLGFKFNKLYGRSGEVKRLAKAYDESCLKNTSSFEESSTYPGMILVSGYGGSGKTTLVQSLKDPVLKSGGYYVSGKFDAIQRNTPYSAFIEALSELCTAILENNEDTNEEIKDNITSVVNSEGMILMELIPNLHMIMRDSDEERKKTDQNVGAEGQHMFADGIKAQNKLSFVFRRFMRAVATHDHPLVMVLDDLQWADTASLNLLQNIVTDSENKSPLLIVGCYRNNEVGDDHPLLKTIDQIERLKYSSRKKKIDLINIDNLSCEDINEMISDALITKRRVTRKKLANVVHHKTSGNPLFTVQFLKSLVEDSTIYFDMHTDPKLRQWRWDIDKILKKNVSNGVVEFLAHKIRTRLSEEARNVLKLAACIGSTFELQILEMVVNSGRGEMALAALDQLEDHTLLNYITVVRDDLSEVLGHLTDDGFIEDIESKSEYKFTHDHVYQAAYTCMPDVERTAMHYQIGEIMWQTLNSQTHCKDTRLADEALDYILADQLNKGSALISDESKRISLARLNLVVAENCTKKMSYETAVAYLEAGIKLLDGERCWKENYSLALCLHNTMAEVQYSTGNFESIQRILNEVFIHALSFEDKLNAYSTHMMVLAAQGKTDDSIQIGLSVLDTMGERFPSSISVRTILADILRTKWMLKKQNNASLLELPLMTNKSKIRVMKFLSALLLYCGVSKPMMLPLILNRMIGLSISYGLCESSAYAFAGYGYILCHKFGDKKAGHKYGKLSLSLVEKCGGKEWFAKIYFVVAGCIDYWINNPLLGHESLLDGYKTGMEVGDFEYANMCAILSMRDSFFNGESLVTFENKSKMLCHQFAEYGQEFSLRLCAPIWQTLLNLVGKSENPGELSGKAIDFESSLHTNTHDMTEFHQVVFFFFEIYLAYMFGKNVLAAERSVSAQDLFSRRDHPIFTHFFIFYDALNNIAMASSTKERRWDLKAKKKIKEIKILAKKLPRHFLHKKYLINAKYAAYKGKRGKAAKNFDAAITGAAKAGLCNDEALAYEEAGIFYLMVGNKQRASQCFVDAHRCYLNWGAQAKAEYLYNHWMTK